MIATGFRKWTAWGLRPEAFRRLVRDDIYHDASDTAPSSYVTAPPEARKEQLVPH